MDSLTHIALGACMGEAFAGAKLGRKALLWGALAQSIPDIDFIASFWMPTANDVLAHRGFTHSILFCGMITIAFALLARKWHRQHTIPLRNWLLFFGVAIFFHIFIDAFNNYGTGWFEPFSHKRISFNMLYVADPLFSVWPMIACGVLIIKRKSSASRKFYWQWGLGLSGIYLCLCTIHKYTIDRDVKDILQEQHISYTRYFTTPAPLQNWLWYVVAGNNEGYYVGYRSVFDKKKQIKLTYFPRMDTLLSPLKNREDVQKLLRFSQEFYTVENWKDTLVFNDLRFGQMMGWQNPTGKFVFHYYLLQPELNNLIVQRGRWQGWNRSSLAAYLSRIEGND